MIQQHIQQPVNANTTPKKAKMVLIFGIVQIVLGILILGFAISVYKALEVDFVPLNQHSTGTWVSCWIITTGILGVCVGCKPHVKGLVGTYNGFVIASSVMTIGIVVLSAITINAYAKCSYDHDAWNDRICDKNKGYGTVVYAALLVLGLTELAVSITSNVYSCGIFNCCSSSPVQSQSPQQPMVYENHMALQQPFQMMQPSPGPQQTVTSSTGQQFVLVPIVNTTQPYTPIVSSVPPQGREFPEPQ